VDLSEYEDVAAEALSRCLERFEPSKARFHTYCAHRIRGALLDAKAAYLRWRTMPPSTPVGVQADRELLPWLATVSPWLHRYATLALDGYTQREIAAHLGITESAVSKRLKWWRGILSKETPVQGTKGQGKAQPNCYGAVGVSRRDTQKKG